MQQLRVALSVAALILLAGMYFAGINSAQAQSPALTPAEQAIQQRVYGSCVQDGKLGAAGGELETNCQCEAQVTLSVLTDAGRTAIETGQPPQGPMFTVDQEGFSRKVIQSCPGVRPVLEHHFCDPDPNSQACLKLKSALQQTQ
ncbi:MAG TPA: hypothetical protein VGM59_10635 [Dongiaceae bacterium]|jgi:hypothetical protein